MEPVVQSKSFICAYCGERNDTFVDPAQGRNHTYIEDCQVCCRPNQLHIHFDEWNKSYQIRAEMSR